MNTQITVRPESAASIRATPDQLSQSLLPQNMAEAMRLADMMATAKLVPAALQKSPADCLMVIMQAMRWQMDPFAVAQECSVIQNKLMYSGKLAAAVINARGNLAHRLSFSYDGDGDKRTITVIGHMQGETEARTVNVRLVDARTNNRVWQTQPDQQLMYHGSRVWGRRHAPELMLGVWSEEEFPEPEEFEKPPRTTAVARKAEIAAIKDDDEREAATEYAHERDAEHVSQGMIKAANARPGPATDAEIAAAKQRFLMKNRKQPEGLPPHDEDGVIIEPPKRTAEQATAALQFMSVTRDVIRTAKDAKKLTAWLGSESQIKALATAGLTDAELQSLRDFARERLTALKVANGNGRPSYEDPEGFHRYVVVKFDAAKDLDELATTYAELVEPIRDRMFPPDADEIDAAYGRREQQIKAE
jgi:hypothetical protein